MTRRGGHFQRDRILRLMRLAPAAVLAIALAGCGGASSPDAVSDSAATSTQPAGETVGSATPPAPDRLPASVIETSRPQSLAEADALFETLAGQETAPADWEQAQQRLIELGAAAVPTLERELASSESYRREVAASGLAMLGPDSATAAPALQQALQDASIHVRANAATALCAIPEQEAIVIPALAELLVSDDEQVRQMSAVNLSNFGEDAAPYVGSLTRVLERVPNDVLVPMLELLGRIGPPAEAAAPRLQQIAFEQTGEAQQAAQAALEKISEKPAAE